MIRIRSSVNLRDDERGVTLIELIVAMMIFALISVAISVSVTSVLSMTSGSRARVAATNLAAGEIDLVRSYEDVFKVLSKTTPKIVDGTNFTITRSTSWVSTAGTDVSCSSAGGALQYKRVNVTVTWPGNPSSEVRADTLLTPSNRINEPTTGTILVSVKAASGQGTPDVTIDAAPTTLGAALTTIPPMTDADGCSYILKVVPGTYTVSISKTGNVDHLHNPAPTLTVTVLAGKATAASFAFDTAATYKVKYTATPPPASALPGTIIVPSTMDTSIYGGGVPVVRSLSSTMSLFPQTAGYQMVTGAFAVDTATKPCTVVDPTAWLDDETVAPPRIGQLPNIEAAVPPASADIPVPVGVVTVTGDASGTRYLFAERVITTATSATGQPRCTQTVTYSFSTKVIPSGASNLVTVGLPFGTWKLYSSNNANGTSPTVLDTNRVTVRTSPQPASGTTFTLDPRAVAP